MWCQHSAPALSESFVGLRIVYVLILILRQPSAATQIFVLIFVLIIVFRIGQLESLM